MIFRSICNAFSPEGLKRLSGLGTACALMLGAGSAFAQSAQDFPSRPIRIVYPFNLGSSNDTVLRMIGDRLAEKWGQPVVIESKPGASSMIATASVANAAPDGHTLLANITLMLQNPALRSKLPYDPAALVPVTQLNLQQLPIYAHKDVPANNMAEFIELARQQPGKLNFGTWGLGSTAHIILEQIKRTHNVDIAHVPYKGSTLVGVLGKEVDAGSGDFLGPLQHFKSGTLKILAVTGAERKPEFPDIPTLAESGVPGFETYNWFGIYAPAGTPKEILQKISDGIQEVQADPELDRHFRENFLVTPVKSSPEHFAEVNRVDGEKWRKVIKDTGITLEN